MEGQRTYISIDLKSFYASQECRERNLDPLTTNLVVADASRTEKTICLAVSPSMKAYGIPGRARLFEVIRTVRQINRQRELAAPGHKFTGKSCNDLELKQNPSLALDYIIATPQMAHYMEHSTKIYQIYLKYVAPEHIHVYSIDEVMMDATQYLHTAHMSPHEFARTMIQDVLQSTGITATAGIGTNLYLSKVAMDIEAKHIPPDRDGVRIAVLDEESYRRKLWTHRPITDFWRVGRGYAKKLEAVGLFTMGDVARCSLGREDEFYNEDLLYKLFGVNAETLIDHAWGWEPCGLADIKAYRPENNSIGAGQVLMCPYTFEKARLIVREMTDALVLDLVEKRLVTDQIILTVGYDIESLSSPALRGGYAGEVTTDFYGRTVPKHAHGTAKLGKYSSSGRLILNAVMDLYGRIVSPALLVRRINVTAGHVISERSVSEETGFGQLSLFDEEAEREALPDQAFMEKERRMQLALLNIKKKYGKNAILKGTSYEEGATGRSRNQQIGGHRA